MKNILIALGAFCLIGFTSCKDNAAKKIEESNLAAAAKRDAVSSKFPKIEFDKTIHDFGEIEAKTRVETVFKYKNTGEAPLVITDIKSTCGCTVPQDWSREPLAVGETGEFTVKFDGTGQNKVTKTVTITANTEKGTETVKVSAFVKPDPNAKNIAPKPNLTVPSTTVKSSTRPGHEGHNHD
ncbi:DUF1573 domain-containing protein [Gelatiniphilus marinus]|uniref:DUF1573 domain-containing protein n=1 Tax=Gelatiniphilus marinus TaxID=1759464 RepID=A0ABW5JUD7_9FLAO